VKQQRKKIKNIFTETDKRTGRKYETVSLEWPDGKRFRARCANRELAKQLLARINGAIVCGTWEALRNELRPPREQKQQPAPVPAGKTFGQLVTEFKKYALDNSFTGWGRIQGYLADGMVEFFDADTLITQINQKRTEEFKVFRVNEDDARPCTVNKDLAVLRAMFKKAIDWKYLPEGTENPAAKVENYPDDTLVHARYLLPEKQEYQRLLAAAITQRESLRRRPGRCFMDLPEYIVIAVNCGLRLSEMLALPLGNINMEHSILSVKNLPNKRTKNGRERHIHFNSETQQAITVLKQRAVNPSGPLFQLPGGCGWTKHKKVLQNQFGEVVSLAELSSDDPMQNVTIHTLRHTFGSWLAINGTPVGKIQYLMGHTSITTTERYMHLSLKETVGITAVLQGMTAPGELATNWQQPIAVRGAIPRK
jgi:integrase